MIRQERKPLGPLKTTIRTTITGKIIRNQERGRKTNLDH